MISIIGFVYDPIHELFEPTYKLSLNGTLLYELNGGNGEDYISGTFKNEDETFAFLENYFRNREVEVSEINPIPEKNKTQINMDKLNIKVELRKINKEDSNLKGFADITLAGVTIKDVAVKKIPTKGGKIVAFDMPNIDKYQDKEGNMKYIKSVSLNSKKDNLIPEIRKALLEALTSNETNEYGKTVINHETYIEYDKDYVKSYIRPLSFENNPYIKATSRVLVGGVLALNNVRLNEGVSKEGNEFQSISVPEKKIEQDYKPLVYLDKDLREKIKDNLVTEYNKETKEQEANNEETEEDEI